MASLASPQLACLLHENPLTHESNARASYQLSEKDGADSTQLRFCQALPSAELLATYN